MKIKELKSIAEEDNFWNDQSSAKAIMQQIAELDDWLDIFGEANLKYENAKAFWELASEAEDETLTNELQSEIDAAVQAIDTLEVRNMLSGIDDDKTALLQIHSGAGGTEAQDWAEMLLRMYTRWAERHNYKVYLVDELEGDGAGIKSATIEVAGKYAYGYLKAETGVHRLVRISPFDSNARRHTSFASVFVYPEVGDDVEIDIGQSH